MYRIYIYIDFFISAWKNNKIVQEIEERQRVDEIAFKKAGSGPLIKTYKYNPTKQKNIIAVKAKSK